MMLVQILKNDTYNDAHHRARLCQAGDILETTVEYGQSLIAAGLAKLPGRAEPEAPAQDETSAEAEPTAGEVEVAATADAPATEEVLTEVAQEVAGPEAEIVTAIAAPEAETPSEVEEAAAPQQPEAAPIITASAPAARSKPRRKSNRR
jgi:hypothetical protein